LAFGKLKIPYKFKTFKVTVFYSIIYSVIVARIHSGINLTSSDVQFISFVWRQSYNTN